MKKSVFISAILCIASASMLAQAPNRCEQLAKAKVENTTIASVAIVSTGELKLPPNPFGTVDAATLPAFCRVQGSIHPTADSDIGFEVWMPVANWNGKYVQMGNGGLAGQIDVTALADRVKAGYAAAATDDGHKGSGTDGSWALGHPEKIIDFAYRAVHETNRVSKELVGQFYGHTARYSYFNGCSEGGREALMEAQRYPKDFNGILVGSPGHAWTGLLTAFAWNAQALNSPESFISEGKRKTIEKAALAACASPKGVDDKFIDDPQRCHFDPSVLLCKGADSDDCLTKPQLDALQKIYAGPKDPRTGQHIAPGYEPGAEAEPGLPGLSFASYVFGSGPGMSLDAMFSNAFFGDFVFDDAKWNFTKLNFDADLATIEKKAGMLNAINPDLSAFKAAGGKMLHYHGWYDGSPSPLSSVEYYESVEQKLGAAQTEGFYKLYMVPGMMHCGTGPGPNTFGNRTDPAPKPDPEHNIGIALEQWVEQGKAPDAIIATKYVDDTPAKGVEMTRPLCAYPKVARWNGKGDSHDAANWRCASPK